MPNFYFNYTYSPNLKVAGDLEVDGNLNGPGGNNPVTLGQGAIIPSQKYIIFLLAIGQYFRLYSNGNSRLVIDGTDSGGLLYNFARFYPMGASPQVRFDQQVTGNQIGNSGITHNEQNVGSTGVGKGASYTPNTGIYEFRSVSDVWGYSYNSTDNSQSSIRGTFNMNGSSYFTNHGTTIALLYWRQWNP